MKIYTDTPEGTTVIQNSFIDRYMPHANGEFVKVYLYLLRCANTGRELSLSSIADVFEHTEKDVQRAIAYWQKQGLLAVTFSSDEEIESAIAVATDYFEKHFEGCTLTEMTYPGDDKLDDWQEFAERNHADDVMVLVSTFEVDASGGDGSLNPNSTYTNWKWILVRTDGGKWRHVDHGY